MTSQLHNPLSVFLCVSLSLSPADSPLSLLSSPLPPTPFLPFLFLSTPYLFPSLRLSPTCLKRERFLFWSNTWLCLGSCFCKGCWVLLFSSASSLGSLYLAPSIFSGLHIDFAGILSLAMLWEGSLREHQVTPISEHVPFGLFIKPDYLLILIQD